MSRKKGPLLQKKRLADIDPPEVDDRTPDERRRGVQRRKNESSSVKTRRFRP